MNKKTLKFSIIVKLALFVILIIMLLLFNKYFLAIKSDLYKEQEEISSKFKEYQKKVNNFYQKTKDIEQSLEIWKKLGGEQAYFDGIKISEVKIMLDFLKEKYLFKELDIKMSKPIIEKNMSSASFVVIESSQINLKIRAYSDVDMMMFLNDLNNLLHPSYLIINSYSINKEVDLPRVINKLQKEGGGSSVYTDINLYWKELKTL